MAPQALGVLAYVGTLGAGLRAGRDGARLSLEADGAGGGGEAEAGGRGGGGDAGHGGVGGGAGQGRGLDVHSVGGLLAGHQAWHQEGPCAVLDGGGLEGDGGAGVEEEACSGGRSGARQPGHHQRLVQLPRLQVAHCSQLGLQQLLLLLLLQELLLLGQLLLLV